MIMILVALICGAISATLVLYHTDDFEGAHFIGLFLASLVAISCVAYAFAGWSWLAAGYKAEIINREYKTNYTREEIFYANDIIDTIREIQRKRIEVNGNILREEK